MMTDFETVETNDLINKGLKRVMGVGHHNLYRVEADDLMNEGLKR